MKKLEDKKVLLLGCLGVVMIVLGVYLRFPDTWIARFISLITALFVLFCTLMSLDMLIHNFSTVKQWVTCHSHALKQRIMRHKH